MYYRQAEALQLEWTTTSLVKDVEAIAELFAPAFEHLKIAAGVVAPELIATRISKAATAVMM